MAHPFRKVFFPVLALLGVFAATAAIAEQKPAEARRIHNMVVIPEEDRFTPFALTIHAGDGVLFTNNDTDDHAVVTDEFVSSTGPTRKPIDRVIPGTENNDGKPGTLLLRFGRPGVFVYYCRFHSHLDESHQPVAPGPDGGIQDDDGNYGTPMMGVITVLPSAGQQ
jgi:plastocyanin